MTGETRHRFVLRVEVGGPVADLVERLLAEVAGRLPGAMLSRNDYEVRDTGLRLLRRRKL